MKLQACTLLACLGALSSASIIPSWGFKRSEKAVQSLDFEVRSGKTFKSSEAGARPKFVKRADTHEVEITNENYYYAIEIEIGSAKEKVSVVLDTGSSDLWVESTSNPYCESSSSSDDSAKVSTPKKGRLLRLGKTSDEGGEGGASPTVELETIPTVATSVSPADATLDCAADGTFDPSSSTTYHNNDTEFFIQYGDYSFALGTWGYDDIVIGGQFTVDDLSFAIANVSNSSSGVFGIGLKGLEATYAGEYRSGYEYENLPAKMVDEGLINKAAYSLYLDSATSASGSVLFGGVDHDKYSGTLGLMPIINTVAEYGYPTAIMFEVTLSGIYLPNANGDETAVITETLSPALLDSGTTLTYAPSNVVDKIGSALNAEYDPEVGAYILDCSSVSDDAVIEYDLSGKVIKVPISQLLISLTNEDGSESSYCAVGVLGSGDNSYILGDSFLRSAYVVYDLEALQIAVAQANLDSTSEDVEEIVSTIPSATSVSGYSTTWSVDATDNTGISYITGTAVAQ